MITIIVQEEEQAWISTCITPQGKVIYRAAHNHPLDAIAQVLTDVHEEEGDK